LDVELRDRLTRIDTHLDDLQSGVDAGSREANYIQRVATSIDRLQLEPLERTDLIGTLMRHSQELQACVTDQRGALRELRDAVARLREQLTRAVPVRPPPVNATDRQ